MLHVPAYGLLALLWIFTLRDHGVTEDRSIVLAFLVASAYGTLTELHQVWIPGRFASAFDVTFNVAGSLIFVWLYWWASNVLRVKSGEQIVVRCTLEAARSREGIVEAEGGRATLDSRH
jgi:VanZ family protein